MATPKPPGKPDWTCPFCSLLCEGFGVSDGPVPRLVGSDCPRSQAGLAAHRRPDTPAQGRIDGTPVPIEQAIAAAAERLAAWQQPFFGGLGTDVGGARALYRLAARTGAICDHADGDALMHGVRALQDRGQYYTTLGEVRTRADLIVCVGTQPTLHYPEFFRRCGIGAPASPCRELVFFDAPVAPGLPAGLASEIAGSGDLFADLQQLCGWVAQQRLRRIAGDADSALADLAERLRAARYAVLVWEASVLPPHGALLVEALNRIVAVLNRHTRAATFSLGGSDGAYSANQVFTWLSGLPLRSRAGPLGLEHEPLLFGGDRVQAQRACDGLLWVHSFDPSRLPRATDLPCVLLGPPAMAERLQEHGRLADCVFIPVATPGINAPGHLFRTDGGIVLPLVALRDDALPDVASVLGKFLQRVEGVSQ